MSCAACSAHVEKAVAKVPGVTSCSVSLLTNSMNVEGSATEQEIIEAVEKAGYGADKKRTKKEAQRDAGEDVLKKKAVFHQLLQSLHQLIDCFVPAFLNIRHHTTPDMICKQYLIKTIQRRIRRRHLNKNIRTIPAFLHHPPDPPYLPLNTIQTVNQILILFLLPFLHFIPIAFFHPFLPHNISSGASNQISLMKWAVG